MFFFLEANQDPIGTIMGPGFASSGKNIVRSSQKCVHEVQYTCLDLRTTLAKQATHKSCTCCGIKCCMNVHIYVVQLIHVFSRD